MTAYALLRNGEIVAIPDVTPSATRDTLDVLSAALRGAGLAVAPKVYGTGGWIKSDPARMGDRDVLRVELWGEPDPAHPAIANRAGCHYCWCPSEYEQQAAAYQLAGGKLDDYLRDLAA